VFHDFELIFKIVKFFKHSHINNFTLPGNNMQPDIGWDNVAVIQPKGILLINILPVNYLIKLSTHSARLQARHVRRPILMPNKPTLSV
jgi:hypothetical protein